MSTQPEALRLADQLRDMSSKFKAPSHERGVCNGAIQELRRLHALNQELLAVAEQALAAFNFLSIKATTEKDRDEFKRREQSARAAIAKAGAA